MPLMLWSDAAIERLLDLRGEGMTSVAIADILMKEFGVEVTPNAVKMKAKRLSL